MPTKLLLLIAASLQAHDLYLMPQTFTPAPGARILLSAHTGDSFPVSEQAVDPARLKSWPEGDWRMLGRATHTTFDVKPGGQFFAVSTAPRLLEMEPAKFAAYLKEEGLAITPHTGRPNREMYAKFAKTWIVAGKPTPNFSTPLGLRIEIVPLADPSQVAIGESLPIQLLFDGKPCAGVQLEIATAAGHKVVGRTDAMGKLSVPITSAARTRLHAVHMIPASVTTHEWESFWASFTFEPQSARTPESSNLTNR
jgi:hypothetical protein